MPKLPEKIGTIHSINENEYGGAPRTYLGMSGIGGACWRSLWYGFHWAKVTKHNARSERIFSIGHLFEQVAIAELKSAGCFVFRLDKDGNSIELTGEKGEEQEELTGFGGHAGGHPDGRIIGLIEYPHQELLLELKTMKDDKFKSFKRKGVINSHPVYYGQAQRYMDKMGLKVCFFLAVNKNTAEYWWEFIHFDREFAAELKRKEMVIIISDEPPERGHMSSSLECSWCEKKGICHFGEEPDQNCRTCEHCDFVDDGEILCDIQDEKKLSVVEQRSGCSKWSKGWGL